MIADCVSPPAASPAAIQVEGPGADKYADQADEAHDEGRGHLVEGIAVDRAEELRTALIADRIDEHGKED